MAQLRVTFTLKGPDHELQKLRYNLLQSDDPTSEMFFVPDVDELDVGEVEEEEANESSLQV